MIKVHDDLINSAVLLGRLQVELEATLPDKGLTSEEWHSEVLRVCAREGLSLICVDYLNGYFSNKYCGES